MNRASGILLFLVVNTVWVFFFGPLYTASRLLILVLALTLIPKGPEPEPARRRVAALFPFGQSPQTVPRD